jgi:hypothetical protein
MGSYFSGSYCRLSWIRLEMPLAMGRRISSRDVSQAAQRAAQDREALGHLPVSPHVQRDRTDHEINHLCERILPSSSWFKS